MELKGNFVILDAARIFSDLYTAQSLQKEFLNLYKGQPDELDAVAPHLFAYQFESEFAGWLKENGWGKSWGVFLETPASMEELLVHFKKFLYVKTDDGKDFFFRFYDPRVMRKFLLRYDAVKLKAFFGPVTRFFCEDEDESFTLSFSFDGFKLVTERIETAKIFPPSKIIGTTNIATQGKIENTANEASVELKANRPARKFFD